MCSGIDRPLVIVTPRILSVVRRVGLIPGRGGGGVMYTLTLLVSKNDLKCFSTIKCQPVRLLCLAHESICSSSVVRV